MNEPQGIAFQGRLSPQEFRAIHAGMMRPLTWMCGGVAALSIITQLVFGHAPWQDRDPLRLALTWVPLLIVLLGPWWMSRLLFRAGWTQNKIIQQSVTGNASEMGIDWRTETTQMNLPWDLLHKARLSDSLVLVFTSPKQAFFFPRSFFASNEDWTRFRALVERKLPRSRR